MPIVKLHSNGLLYSNTLIGTLTVDGCTKYNSRPINGQCTNYSMWDYNCF